MQLNSVTLAGFLGKDPEVFKTSANKTIVTLSVAHTAKSGDKEYTTWARVKVFEPWSHTAKEYAKGDNVIVQGALSTNEWDDKKTGEKRSSLEIKAFSIGRCAKERKEKEAKPMADFDTVSAGTMPVDDLPF